MTGRRNVAGADRPSVLRAKLEAVRLDFTEGLPPRLRALQAEVLEALEAGEPVPARWNAIRNDAHRLAGAGTTFGHPAVSRMAAELERRIEAVETTPPPWSPALTAALREAAMALGRLAPGGEVVSPIPEANS